MASPRGQSAPLGKVEAARRLFAASGPIAGTLGEAYLRHRALAVPANGEALRFHPRCYYRDVASGRRLEFPALIGAVTDAAGALTGVLRTWLAPDGKGLAPIDTPRRASGRLLGGGVRFGLGAKASSILFAGEGIETMLSLRAAMPGASLIAALSANHLAACSFPKTLRRLYVAVDADLSGRRALARLIDRGREAGIEVVALHPALGDFNDDLRSLGLAALRAGLRGQLIPCDAAELLPAAM